VVSGYDICDFGVFVFVLLLPGDYLLQSRIKKRLGKGEEEPFGVRVIINRGLKKDWERERTNYLE
jgi:hypothetical protein